MTAQGSGRLDLGVEGGRIVALGEELGEAARSERDARGLHVLPGLVDLHVHFNQPGRERWEGLASGSGALLAGGGTTFGDMPLNSDPPLLDAAAFRAKLAAARAHSQADFALWGGLTPLNLEQLPELAEEGVLGFKAFMSDSGIPEFPAADDETLRRGMETARQLDLPVAVHAESQELTARLGGQLNRPGAGWREYLESRPPEAELEAIGRALGLARETGCRLHVVHVSTPAGLALISRAKAEGVDVSAETCPHYLAFSEADLLRQGALLKCAPPLRDDATVEGLWRSLLAGEVDTVGSDHSPCDPALKQGDAPFQASPFEVWGGIAGVQSSLAVMLTEGYARRGLSLEAVARLTAGTPARRFRLAGKGELRVGHDADLTLIDLGAHTRLEVEDLQQRWPATSPYLGRTFSGRLRATLLRGEVACEDSRLNDGIRGRLLRPG